MTVLLFGTSFSFYSLGDLFPVYICLPLAAISFLLACLFGSIGNRLLIDECADREFEKRGIQDDESCEEYLKKNNMTKDQLTNEIGSSIVRSTGMKYDRIK